MADVKKLLTVLRLDNKQFKSNMTSSTKLALGFSAAAAATAGAVIALAKQTANYNDRTIKTARSAGVLSDQFSKLAVAADFSGVSQEMLAKSLGRLSALTPSTQKQLQALGVSIEDVNGNVKSSNELFYETADAIAGMKTPSEKTAAAIRIFGEEGAKMVSLMSGGTEGLKNFSKEAENLGLVVSEQAGVAAEKYNDDIARLGMATKGLSNTIGNAVIDFVNESDSINGATRKIQSMIKWVNGLDDGTKNMIKSLVAVTAATATVVTGILAMKAGIIAAKSALPGLVASFNPLLALAAVPILITVLVMKEEMDQSQARLERLQNAIDLLAKTPGKLQDVRNMFAGFAKATGSVEGLRNATFEAKVGMANYAKSMGVATREAVAISNNFDILGQFIEMADKKLQGLHDTSISGVSLLPDSSISMTQRLREEINNLATESQASLRKVVDLYKELDNSTGSAKRLSEASVEDKLRIAELAKQLGLAGDVANSAAMDFDTLTQFIQQADAKLAEMDGLKKFSQTAIQVTGIVSQVSNSLTQLAANAAAAIKRQFEQLSYNVELASGLYSNYAQQDIDNFTAAQDQKLAELKKAGEEQLKQLQENEDAKLNAIKRAIQEKNLLLDEDYQRAKEKAEEKFEEEMETARENFEIRLAELDTHNLIEEERRATKAAMETSWLRYRDMQERQHQQTLTRLASEYQNKRNEENELANQQLRDQTNSSNAALQQYQNDANNAYAKAEEQKQAGIEARQKKKAEAEKRNQKILTFIQWQGEKAAFEQTKSMQIANTMVAGIAGAAQVFSGTAGLFPPFSLILAAVLAAGVLGVAISNANMIRSQQMPPPVSLFLADGGTIRSDIFGGPSAGDVVPAMLTPGESVIDASTTRKIADYVDTGSDRAVTIVFQEGAIQNRGDMDEKAIDRLTKEISYRIQREAVVY